MTQNIYDDPQFFQAYSQFRRSVLGLEGAPEWPALRALLPPMDGLRVVDLGCGFGWFCRWARGAGAAAVLGVDVSRNMLARARAETADDAVTYARADLEEVRLPEGGFDLAHSSLALHYVEDLEKLVACVRRALVPGGRFVFSIEHPIYMAPTRPGWVIAADGSRTWPVDSYQREGRRSTDWLTNGVIKYHRTLATTLNLLIRQGFVIRHVDEWRPTAEQIAAIPQWAEEMERPMFLLVAAERRST
jgi:SAM-dependent methyltransferase